MSNFFVEYENKTNLQPMLAEIGWTHNIIMERCKGGLEKTVCLGNALYDAFK